MFPTKMHLQRSFAIQLLALLLVLHQQNVQCEEKPSGGFFSKWSFGKKEVTTTETTEATTVTTTTADSITTTAPKSSWSFPKFSVFSKNETKKAEELKKPDEKVEEKKSGWFSGFSKPKVEGQKEEVPKKDETSKKDEAAKKESGWFSSFKGRFSKLELLSWNS